MHHEPGLITIVGEEVSVAHRLIWQGLLPDADLTLRERMLGEVILERLRKALYG